MSVFSLHIAFIIFDKQHQVFISSSYSLHYMNKLLYEQILYRTFYYMSCGKPTVKNIELLSKHIYMLK